MIVYEKSNPKRGELYKSTTIPDSDFGETVIIRDRDSGLSETYINTGGGYIMITSNICIECSSPVRGNNSPFFDSYCNVCFQHKKKLGRLCDDQ